MARASHASDERQGDLMERIKTAHTRLIDLWNAHDLDGYMEMVHDKARGILPTVAGPPLNRRALRDITAQLFDSNLSVRVDFEQLHFVELDNVAIVTGVATLRARRRDGSVVSDTSNATLTYVRDDGVWKIIAGHYSPVISPDATSAFFA
jgi:uncharacterized protein (TIGR02246 family)